MKNSNKLKYPIICIAVAVGLLFIKDNFAVVWNIICGIFTALAPIAYGFIIAYILNFPYKFFKDKAFGRLGKKNTLWQKCVKPVSLVVSYLVVLGVIALIIGVVVPQIATSIMALAENLPGYYETFQVNVEGIIEWIKNTFGISMEGFGSLSEIIGKIADTVTGGDLTKFAQNLVDAIFPAAVSTVTAIYNWVIGIIISIYMLASKESLCRQVKRLTVSVIPIKWLPKVYELVDVMDTKCGRFIVGKILDSSIIGVMCFILMSIFRMDYALLISVLTAVCNIIPFFGPFISAIPAAFLLLMIDPVQCIIFIIMIIVLQQIDGNFIGPKIVGDKVGLSGFWALFSVIVGGNLFGFPGLILGTPVFAAIYTLLRKKVNNKIDEKGNIAQQALDFEVLKYSEIAEEQKRLKKEYEGTHVNISKFLQNELDRKKNNQGGQKHHKFFRRHSEEEQKAEAAQEGLKEAEETAPESGGASDADSDKEQ